MCYKVRSKVGDELVRKGKALTPTGVLKKKWGNFFSGQYPLPRLVLADALLFPKVSLGLKEHSKPWKALRSTKGDLPTAHQGRWVVKTLN